jgi:hypothetical protein
MATIRDIGEVREDGSILLYDENIDFRKDFTTPRRVRQTAAQKQKLAEMGLQYVTSSFISAIGVSDSDLVIRFLNGSYYRYFGFADRYEPMLKANSKGRYFWRNIRSTKNYVREGSISFDSDMTIDDTQLFKEMSKEFNQVVLQMIKLGVTKVVYDEATQREYLKVSYKGETIFLNILPE